MKKISVDYRIASLYVAVLGYFVTGLAVMKNLSGNPLASVRFSYALAALGFGVARILALPLRMPRARLLRVPAYAWFYAAALVVLQRLAFARPPSDVAPGAFTALPATLTLAVLGAVLLDFQLACWLDDHGAWDEAGRRWTYGPGAEVREMEGHFGGVRALAFTPDGKFLISGGQDGTAVLWDAASGAAVRFFTGVASGTSSLAASPDGLRLLTGHDDGFVRRWRISDGTLERTLAESCGKVASVAIDSGGTFVVAGGADGVARIWSLETGKLTHALHGHVANAAGLKGVNDAEFSPDGRLLVTAGSDRTLRVWDVKTGTAGPVFADADDGLGVDRAAFTPDGKNLVSVGAGHAVLRDASEGTRRLVMEGLDEIAKDMTVSPDGKRLAAAYAAGARLWDLETGKSVRIFRGHSGWVNAVAISPEGRFLATGGEDGRVKLWNML